MRFSADLNSMLGNKEPTTDSWRSMESDRLDREIRVLWAEYGARAHGWTYNGIPPNDVATGRFICDWHEQEYQVFKAGYQAAKKQG